MNHFLTILAPQLCETVLYCHRSEHFLRKNQYVYVRDRTILWRRLLFSFLRNIFIKRHSHGNYANCRRAACLANSFSEKRSISPDRVNDLRELVLDIHSLWTIVHRVAAVHVLGLDPDAKSSQPRLSRKLYNRKRPKMSNARGKSNVGNPVVFPGAGCID